LGKLIAIASDPNAGEEELRRLVEELGVVSVVETPRRPASKLVTLAKMISPEPLSAMAMESVEEPSEGRTEIQKLAREYERLRRTMKPSNERTQLMEGVASQMRMLTDQNAPLLDKLAHSASAGERLAAVMMLQERPQENYLDWLAARVAQERPFIGYHACVA